MTRRMERKRRSPFNTQRTLSRTVKSPNPELIIHKVGKVTKFKLRTERMLITYKADDAKNINKVLQHVPASMLYLARPSKRGNQQEGHQEEDQEVTILIDSFIPHPLAMTLRFRALWSLENSQFLAATNPSEISFLFS